VAVTPAIVRAHVETDLEDPALQRLIDDAVAAMEARAGVGGPQVVPYQLVGRSPSLWLLDPATAVSQVREGYRYAELTVVDPATYTLLINGYKLARVDGVAWQPWVEVTSTVALDTARRDRVTIDLVHLALQYSGLSHETSGDYTANPLDYQQERERLVSELAGGTLGIA
jgi:hypothetical protein